MMHTYPIIHDWSNNAFKQTLAQERNDKFLSDIKEIWSSLLVGGDLPYGKAIKNSYKHEAKVYCIYSAFGILDN